VLTGVFITALYSFRMFFLVFHGKERFDTHGAHKPHESPWVVTMPLVALAIPSIVIGGFYIGDMLFGDFFKGAIMVLPEHDVLRKIEYSGVAGFVLHGLLTPAFWLTIAGLVTAWVLYMRLTDIPEKIRSRFDWLHRILVNKYGFDDFNQAFFAAGARGLGSILWKISDVRFIDGFIVNGSAGFVGWFADKARYLQTGMLYVYAFVMIIGLMLILAWIIVS